eukprot:CAMPEP_0206263138 /NCGR_PEP_ID=MMETSP0047_2-20121206/28650_1 /ASSEMBLY_ACC=CAM_ASM_000192 /TAXON_ID=195065 /ORGANISM="Chroomonas mesostigmatica_cf, Strain CCMP1168" /LENGTH=48 /DNA_ID= /DNA_START= /DNA_END= /DNA_ORIENTATION=
MGRAPASSSHQTAPTAQRGSATFKNCYLQAESLPFRYQSNSVQAQQAL